MYSMMNDVKPLPRGERLALHFEARKPFPHRMWRKLPRAVYPNPDSVRDFAEPMSIVRARTQRIRGDVMDAMYAHVAELVRGCCDEDVVSAEWVRVVAMGLKRDVLRAVGVEVK